VATGLAEIGALPHVIEQILNHQSGARRGVAGVYVRAGLETEKAAALARWDAHLAAVVEGAR
jgi:hypothetical protein